jgi:cytochrome c5
VVALLVSAAATFGGCARERDSQATLALIDSVMTELGGQAIGVMNRTQRWRMISSVGPGLPPPGFDRENLPDPDSRGAALLQAHCQSCHWMPAPQMHSAREWPLLLRRMELRAATLGEHMGGPLTIELLGSERLLEGMRWSYMPSAEDADSLLAYLEAHAMPVAGPGEIGTGDDATLYIESCTRCHETPSPKAHTAAEWAGVVGRMQANMPQMGVDPLSEDVRSRIVSFLESHAAP